MNSSTPRRVRVVLTRRIVIASGTPVARLEVPHPPESLLRNGQDVRRPEHCTALGNCGSDSAFDLSTERFRVIERRRRWDEPFDVKEQRTAGPTGADVNVLDALDFESGSFGVPHQLRIDTIHQVAEDLARDLPSDVNDEGGDEQTSDAIGPVDSRRGGRKTNQRASRRDGVKPGVLGVRHQRHRVNALTYLALVASDDLITEDANRRGDNPDREVGGAPVLGELVDTHETGEDRAGPDRERHTNSGNVLCTIEAIRVIGGCRTTREAKANEHCEGGGDIGEVV